MVQEQIYKKNCEAKQKIVQLNEIMDFNTNALHLQVWNSDESNV